MTALLGCGALAVDLGNAYAVKTQLQNAADAGSLAAGKLVLTSQSAARAAALDIVPKNVPASWGTVTNSGDVEFGTWTSSTKTFVVSATNIVTARGRPPCAGEA